MLTSCLQRALVTVVFGLLSAIAIPGGTVSAQNPNAGPVQPWGLPPLPAGVGPVEKFADVSNTPQGKFLEGGAFDDQGNLWFVGIGSGWISYLQPDGKLVPVVNCNPPEDIGQTCEPQGTRWKDGKLYLTTRHRGILTYDPKTKELKTLVYTWRNQLFKGPNDLDFDAEGNLFFTDPWGTGFGPSLSDQSGAVYQYSKDGILRKVIDDLHFPNGIAVPPDDSRLAIGDCTASRMVYAIFATGPTLGNPGAKPDPLHLTFQTVRAATYLPGAGCPDGLHYDVKGNLWIAAGGLGGVLEVDPRGLILGFVPIPAPGGDLSTTNFAFGGQDNRDIFVMAANSGTFWRFKAPYPGLIGPAGVRLPAQ
jgi:gluconolactonase